MNGINRRGQKVVCVIEVEYETVSGAVCPFGPTLNEVYTVRNFIDRNKGVIQCIDLPDFPLDLFIDLVEIESPVVVRTQEPIGWPIAAFRPVQTRETDIGELLKLTKPARQTEPA